MIVNYFKINEIDMLHNFTVVCGKIMHFMATAFFFSHTEKINNWDNKCDVLR